MFLFSEFHSEFFFQTPCKKKKAIVKPSVIRHMIDGFILQESSHPFPVSFQDCLTCHVDYKEFLLFHSFVPFSFPLYCEESFPFLSSCEWISVHLRAHKYTVIVCHSVIPYTVIVAINKMKLLSWYRYFICDLSIIISPRHSPCCLYLIYFIDFCSSTPFNPEIISYETNS